MTITSSQHAGTWRLPRYGQTLAELMPSALAAVGTSGFDNRLGLPPARAIIVLVVDGLGWRQLTAAPDLAPFLTSLPAGAVDCGYPSTTVTSLTSIGTGATPGEHGMVGTSVGVAIDHRPFNLLVWGFGRQDAAERAVDRVIPERFQPVDTVFARAARGGARIDVVTVLLPKFVGSGLTRAALRGARIETADGLAPTLRTAVDVAATATMPTVVYAHHGELDRLGHEEGPTSTAWHDELARVDAAVARAAAALPAGAALVVTADHGMLAIDHQSLTELKGSGLTAGVRLVAGEARARHVYAREGAVSDVLELWRDRLGADFAVRSREESIAEGWFGPTVTDLARERIGDVVVAAVSTAAGGIVHRDLDVKGGRLDGMHGGLTPEELEVPLLVATAT